MDGQVIPSVTAFSLLIRNFISSLITAKNLNKMFYFFNFLNTYRIGSLRGEI
jgi:hypothetical protein